MSRFSRWLQGKQRAMTVKELIRALDHEGYGWLDSMKSKMAQETDEYRKVCEVRAWRYHMAAAFLRYREECIKAGVTDNARFYLPTNEESNDNEA